MTAPMIATLWLASPPATACAVSLAGQQRQGLRLRANERGTSIDLARAHCRRVNTPKSRPYSSKVRASYNAGWLAANELDNQSGHAHALPY
jgi:hypothetical protein